MFHLLGGTSNIRCNADTMDTANLEPNGCGDDDDTVTVSTYPEQLAYRSRYILVSVDRYEPTYIQGTYYVPRLVFIAGLRT